MSEDLELSIRLKADGSGLVGEVKASEQELKRLARAGEDGERSLRRVGTGGAVASRAVKALRADVFSLKNAIAGAGIGFLAKEIVQAGVAMQGFEAGLRAAVGSQEAAASDLSFVRQEADRLGISFADSAKSFTQLAAAARGTSLAGEGVREIFSGVAEAARVMQLSSAEVNGVMFALNQIMSKGVVSSEELRRQLADRIPGAFQTAARAMGVSTQALQKMLETGSLMSDEFLPRFARELRNTVARGLPDATGSAQAAFERLGNAVFDLKIAIADGGFLAAITNTTNLMTDAAHATTFWAESLASVISGPADPVRIADRIAEINSELDRLNKTPDNFFGRVFLGKSGETIAALEAERNRLQALLSSFNSLTSPPSKASTPVPSPSIGFAEHLQKNRANLEASLRRELALIGKMGQAAEVRYELELGKLRELDPETKQRLLRLAEEIDFRRTALDLEQQEIELADQLARQQEEDAALRRKLLKERLNDLAAGLQSEFETENRRHQESLRLLEQAQRQGLTTIFSYQTLRERAELEHQRRLIEIEDDRIRTLERGTIDSTDRMRDAARDLGFTFQSAFEDAIVKGNGLRETLAGLAQDIQRIVVRKTVTEPLGGFFADAIGRLFSGSSELGFEAIGTDAGYLLHQGGIAGRNGVRRQVPRGTFATAPRLHRGGLAGDEVPAILRRGEEVLPANHPRHRVNAAGGGITINQTLHIDARGADAGVEQRIRAAMRETSEITLQRVRAEHRNGGPLSRM